MSISVVALGLRYHARAMAPPNWCGTPAESSISWSETILGTRLGYWPASVNERRSMNSPGARRRASGGNRSGSGRRGPWKAAIWAVRSSKSMRASPGSRIASSGGGRDSRAAAIRREDSTNRRISGRTRRGDPAQTLRTGAAAGVRCPSGLEGRGPHRVGIEGPAGPLAGGVEDLRRSGARSWPGFGPEVPSAYGPIPGSRSGPWVGRPRMPSRQYRPTMYPLCAGSGAAVAGPFIRVVPPRLVARG